MENKADCQSLRCRAYPVIFVCCVFQSNPHRRALVVFDILDNDLTDDLNTAQNGKGDPLQIPLPLNILLSSVYS